MHLTFPFTILPATAVYMGLPQARIGILELIVLLVGIPHYHSSYRTGTHSNHSIGSHRRSVRSSGMTYAIHQFTILCRH
jgi:hypothetical protein